jgi:hypothetical protein
VLKYSSCELKNQLYYDGLKDISLQTKTYGSSGGQLKIAISEL